MAWQPWLRGLYKSRKNSEESPEELEKSDKDLQEYEIPERVVKKKSAQDNELDAIDARLRLMIPNLSSNQSEL